MIDPRWGPKFAAALRLCVAEGGAQRAISAKAGLKRMEWAS